MVTCEWRTWSTMATATTRRSGRRFTGSDECVFVCFVDLFQAYLAWRAVFSLLLRPSRVLRNSGGVD